MLKRKDTLEEHLYFIQEYKFMPCSCQWGQTMSVNCGHQRAIVHPQVMCVCVDSHGGMVMTEKKPKDLEKNT